MNVPIPPKILGDTANSAGAFSHDVNVLGALFANKFYVKTPTQFGATGNLTPSDIFNGVVVCCSGLIDTDTVLTLPNAVDLVAAAQAKYGSVSVGDAWRLTLTNASPAIGQISLSTFGVTGATVVSPYYTGAAPDLVSFNVIFEITNTGVVGVPTYTVY
jgi:hypothetical protein